VNLSATDGSGDPLTYSASPLPSGAMLDAASGAFTWSLQTSQIGSYNITFAVSNGQLSDSETVAIVVMKPNTPPVLKPIKPKRVRAGRRVSISLSAKDRERNVLIYSIGPLPTNATFDSRRRKFVWTTTNAPPGTYSLTASVTDGQFTNSQPVSITVY
jgi:hypothetical protein